MQIIRGTNEYYELNPPNFSFNGNTSSYPMKPSINLNAFIHNKYFNVS